MRGKNKTHRRALKNLTGRHIGYARVSTGDQDLTLQIDDLKKQGCHQKHIFVDKSSGARAQRPGLDACLATLRTGDVLHVWRLDRLGRSMPHLISVVEDLRERGVGFRSICDGVIDTTTASGELIFNIFSSLAQFERRLIQERTRAGLKAARARGRRGGRRPLNAKEPRIQMVQKMYQDRNMAISDICQTLNISRATFYRYLSLQE